MSGTLFSLGRSRCTQSLPSDQDDCAVGDIAAVRQDGEDGRREQQPINHVDNPVGRHDVSALYKNAFLT